MKKIRLTAAVLSLLMLAAVYAGCNKTKRDPEALQIAVIAKGYGSAYADALKEGYEKKHPDKVIQIVKRTPDTNFFRTTLQTGERNNIDLYFVLTHDMFEMMTVKNYVKGYDEALADLSDVFSAPAEGYLESGAGVTYASLMDDYALDIMTFRDGKQYGVPWASGVVGLLYNKTLFDLVNGNLSSGEEPFTLPRTTAEMFDLFGRIRALDDSRKNSAYPFVYSGSVGYTSMMFAPWWAQYDGIDSVYKFMEGKDAGGNYSAECYNTRGRFLAYETISKMIRRDSHNVSAADSTKDFTQAQLDFLEGKAFFNSNGEWLEREASSDFLPGEADVAFMKMPIISEITEKLTVIKNEAQLRAAIDYIDGVKTLSELNSAAGLALTADHADIIRLTEARKVRYNEYTYIANVPSYSDKIDLAKDFLKYMLSKEGQETFMRSSYGAMAPLNKVALSQFDYYNPDPVGNRDKTKCTLMTKSKFDMFYNSVSFALYKHPITYMSKMPLISHDPSPESAFGLASPQSVQTFFDNEVSRRRTAWNSYMDAAGLNG